MDWQTFVALGIVAFAAALWVRLLFFKKKGCGGCGKRCSAPQNSTSQNSGNSLVELHIGQKQV